MCVYLNYFTYINHLHLQTEGELMPLQWCNNWESAAFGRTEVGRAESGSGHHRCNMDLYINYSSWIWLVRTEVTFMDDQSWWRPTGWISSRFQFSKEWKIKETCLVILWPSWQFYSGRVWKSHRKEVQKTEHNPKKTQQNAISGDNKRGKGDRVDLHEDSIEMVSVPDSWLTVL